MAMTDDQVRELVEDKFKTMLKTRIILVGAGFVVGVAAGAIVVTAMNNKVEEVVQSLPAVDAQAALTSS
jgi:hypothetical protein